MRTEEKVITFVANKAGIFEFRCNNLTNAHKEGPMVGYLCVKKVLDRPGLVEVLCDTHD